MKKITKILSIGLIVTVTIVGKPVFAADNDFNTSVYNHLENWDTEFEISYYDSDVLELVKEIVKKDDYLERSISRMVYEKVGKRATIKVTYKTTKEQEEYINVELVKIINSIILPNMSDLDKVKTINKYIIDRYGYDKSLKSNNVYSALTTGNTTCQGYSMTAYKMLNLVGIENKIVVGELDGVPHGWNLVKLNEKWYNLDVTNNDSIGNNKYFLKSDKILKKDGFIWKGADYPSSNEDYNESFDNYKAATINNKNGQASGKYTAGIDGKWDVKNSSKYFVKNTGIYAKGWNEIDNKWYYLGNDGVMQVGWINYEGKWYYCYSGSGIMAVNTVIDGYTINSNGIWVS